MPDAQFSTTFGGAGGGGLTGQLATLKRLVDILAALPPSARREKAREMLANPDLAVLEELTAVVARLRKLAE